MGKSDQINYVIRQPETPGISQIGNINVSGNAIFEGVGIGNLTATPNSELEVYGQIIDRGNAWLLTSAAQLNHWYSVTYGNGLFVAVAYNGTMPIMISPDGISWTGITHSIGGLLSVTYGNGLFVAVTFTVTETNQVITSPDGVNWTLRDASESSDWSCVTYGNGLFVAASWSGKVMISTDGINWNSQTTPENNKWNGITYGNGLFVAVASNGTYRIMTSNDGINWSGISSPENNSWQSVTYGNGLFVAVAFTGTYRIMTSNDGITWFSRSASSESSWRSVCYGNGLFVVTSLSGSVLMISIDGITWYDKNNAKSSTWQSIIYKNGMFVAVSSDGDVMVSGKLEEIEIPDNNIYFGDMTIYNKLGVGISADVDGTVDSLSGYRINNSATSGNYLRGNGNVFESSPILSGDLPYGVSIGIGTTNYHVKYIDGSIPTTGNGIILDDGVDISATGKINLYTSGTLGSVSDFITILNTTYDSALGAGTGIGISFKQRAYHQILGNYDVDLGKISFVAESYWRYITGIPPFASSQDSAFSVSTMLNGTLSEKLRVSSSGIVTFNYYTSGFLYSSQTGVLSSKAITSADISTVQHWNRGSGVLYPTTLTDYVGIGTLIPGYLLEIVHNQAGAATVLNINNAYATDYYSGGIGSAIAFTHNFNDNSAIFSKIVSYNNSEDSSYAACNAAFGFYFGGDYLSVSERMTMRIRGGVGTYYTQFDGGNIINAGSGFRINDAATSGKYLRGNGTNYVASNISAADLPSGIPFGTGTTNYYVKYINGATPTIGNSITFDDGSTCSISGDVKIYGKKLAFGRTIDDTNTSYDVIGIGKGGYIRSGLPNASDIIIGANIFLSASDFKNIADEQTSFYWQLLGSHSWYSNPSPGTSGTTFSPTLRMTLSTDGKLGVGGMAVAIPNAYLDISYGGECIKIGGDFSATSRSNNVLKYGIIASSHYSTSYNTSLLYTLNGSGSSIICVGGGNASYVAATDIDFYVANDVVTATGTKRFGISDDGEFFGFDSNTLEFNDFVYNGTITQLVSASTTSFITCTVNGTITVRIPALIPT
jgi:hypothetical protein